MAKEENRNIKSIRNIGVIAHIDAGKTTVTERMLFYSSYVHRVGMVDSGTTVTDFDPEERERGITIQAACVSFDWNDCLFNLIDTPGHVDFTAEVERSLRVLDGGVVVFSAREGVEAQSETVWRQADKYHVPRIAFINKMDREGADFFGTVDQISKRLGATPLIVAIPVGSGPPHVAEAFRGTIDLIAMKQLSFDKESMGQEITVSEIEPDLRSEAELYREKLLDDLSRFNDDITELLLSEQEIPEGMIRAVLREATLSDMAVPVLCGSALDGIGVQPVMDAICHYLPSPADIPPVEGVDIVHKNGDKLTRKADPDEPFCGLIFKIQADKHGDLFYLRVYSGTLKANSRVLNPREDKKENVPQLWRIQADHKEQIQSVSAGDICGVIGLHFSVTGDTLCDVKLPIMLEQITFPDTVISMAIEPESAEENKKLVSVLEMMRRQDPTFKTSVNEETGQTLISGMGELHLEIIKHRLTREYKLKVRIHHPRVSYRESVQRKGSEVGSCNRVIGGVRHFAEIKLTMEPISNDDQSVEILCTGKDESFTPDFKAIVMESLKEESLGGGQLGFPLISTRLTVTGGSFSETDTTETALRIAVSDAYRKALKEAGIVLLEPIMKLEIATPEEYVGDIVSDINQRRGIVTQTHNRGKFTIVEGETPLSNLFGYSSAMLSLTKGRASSSMEPLKYRPAPPDVLKSFNLE
ncbi:MAG: elongation factor G [Planctomycetia bacterium]|nr:elongation factor G [Planctomycetia bacterium]